MTEDILLKKPDNFDSSPDVKQQVASHPQASVWVNASAGSGKTTVLTHRVMRLLLDGVKPEKILCLTYTRAAAAEMSNRVTTKLSFWVTCSDNELSASISDLQGYPPTADQMIKARRLFAQVLSCAGGMRIRTLHAFCQEILRRFPVEANLAPHFTVIEETDARALQDEVLHDLLRDADDDPTSDLGHALQVLVQIGSEHGFDEAMRSVLMERPRLQEALNKAGTAQKLIKQMRDQLQLTPEDTVVSICRAATKDNAFAKAQLRQAGIWLLEGSKSFVPRGERILAWLNEAIDERIEKFDSYGRCFFNADGDVYKNFANKDLLAKYPDLGRILDTEAARLRSVFERLETAQLGETTAAVLTFGAAFIKAFEGRKAAKAVLDYDDLITRTDTLLRRPGIAP